MPVPILASVVAMAYHVLACHTKQKAWRLENGYYVFARGQAVCDLGIAYAKVFGVGVKLPKVKTHKDFDKPLKVSKKKVTADHGQVAKKSVT